MKKIILAIATAVISGSLYGQGLKMAVSSSGEIISGGPTSDAAKAALEAHINFESGGKIVLKKFQPVKTKLSNQNKNSNCEFGFEAQISFSEPCRWNIRQNDESLSFFLLKPDLPSTAPSDAIVISKAGDEYMVFGSVSFAPSTNGWISSGLISSAQPKSLSQFLEDRCVYNLRWISAALAQYQLEHNGKLPFDISTNSGGTLELCVRDSDGNDKNSAEHYKTMSNFLSKTSALVCPADSNKQAARDFPSMTATNITYLFRSAAKDPAQFQRVVLICPIHGYVVDDGGGIEKITRAASSK